MKSILYVFESRVVCDEKLLVLDHVRVYNDTKEETKTLLKKLEWWGTATVQILDDDDLDCDTQFDFSPDGPKGDEITELNDQGEIRIIHVVFSKQ